jgi:hypothetical protein
VNVPMNHDSLVYLAWATTPSELIHRCVLTPQWLIQYTRESRLHNVFGTSCDSPVMNTSGTSWGWKHLGAMTPRCIWYESRLPGEGQLWIQIIPRIIN